MRMNAVIIKRLTITIVTVVTLVSAATSRAHFGTLIPSDSMIQQNESRRLSLVLSFSHPFEQLGMDMAKPERFGVMHMNQKLDLTGTLTPNRSLNHQGWSADVTIKRPGAYIFYVEPKPYWDPMEDIYIIHYTKSVVAAFGNGGGWDREVGLKAEIVPLSRPFGLYAGNVFQGIVKQNGRIVKNAHVEVEYLNVNKQIKAPSDDMITQTVTTDTNGVFSYAPPASGWWGFSAVLPADFTISRDGEEKEVELGGVLWVLFHDWGTEK